MATANSAAMLRANSTAELTELRNEREILFRCPFCREGVVETDEERHKKAMIHAETGKAWAQSYVGEALYSGQEVRHSWVPQDYQV
jgi:hypothetical protein